MKLHKEGIRYRYIVNSVKRREKYFFTICAIHKLSRRISAINTLNPILSELNIPESDKRFQESTWEVDKKKSIFLMNRTKELLADSEYQKYLEKILDEDRQFCEWENKQIS